MKTEVTDGPAAIMGYASDAGGILVRICAWCPDKVQAERTCRAAGLRVTHGICVDCYARMIRDV